MTAKEFMEKMYAGTTPEEILAAKIALHATTVPAGLRMTARSETKYPHEKGAIQIWDDDVVSFDGQDYVPIHVGADDGDECRLAYKEMLVQAARELAGREGK